VADPEFRRDLYQGTAGYYDRFRVPYPPDLIDDLADRAGADGAGRLLDLACGTGQLSFVLRARFAEVWAIDQEPEMIAVVRDKARAAGLTGFRELACVFEDLQASAGSFDLVAIGNAFHRLPRDAVAASTFRWLRPGGFLALVWGGSPFESAATLAGWVMSTSVLSPVALGDRATEFADDLRRTLYASQPDGLFRQTIMFACDLARRPA
jgi:SAM-dependent methyltransferase